MLNEKLDAYLKEDFYPFHMPGAKRNRSLRCDLAYARDLTEIDGFDNLNDPKDIFVSMEERLGQIYGQTEAIISTNGSTCGLLATIRTLTYKNKNILIQRSSHKAVYNAIELNHLKADYIGVHVDKKGAILDIDYENLENMLAKKDYSCLVVTSPSYEGYYLNLEKIYGLSQKYKTTLVVDMAHGSHSPLQAKFETNFDISITSLHKNLSALTPASCVLLNDRSYSKELRRNMAIFQTSSPSYLILQSIDEMIEKFPSFYNLYSILDDRLDKIYNLALKNLEIVSDCNKDKTKILVSCAHANITGYKLAKLLKEYKIEIEMAYPTYALLISTIFDTNEGINRLADALLAIDKNLRFEQKNISYSYKIAGKAMEIHQALEKESELIDLSQAVDRISQQFVYAYPPGIPLLAPGEIIDKSIIDTIKYFQRNDTILNIGDKLKVTYWQKVDKLLL